MMLGKILGGRYKIISLLGGGGFGTTFLAEDRHLPSNPQCVVKQLKPKTTDRLSALQTARRLFDREAEVLYQLGNHDQIPRLFAHFEEDREFYLVQELIEGHELRLELPAGQQLNEDQVIFILRDILEVLTFVHQQNVIHRDIKPANLIRRRQDGRLVLIDFGAVKQIKTQVIDASGYTSSTVAIGSPGYMPNELMAGKPRFSSDIYAVGVLGIQALTGLDPRRFPEDAISSEIFWRDQAQVSSKFADILDRMVRYDFRQRYQSAAEVLAVINSLTPGCLTPTIAVPVTTQNFNGDLPISETVAPDDLSSECGIEYKNLRDLLAAEKWQEADRETTAIMLRISGRVAEDWLREQDIAKFPCTDLLTIDQLWVKYSKGHFGFSIQTGIWESLGGTWNADINIYFRFCRRIGWIYGFDSFVSSSDNLTFNTTAPVGHLPGGMLDWLWANFRVAAQDWWNIIFFLASKLELCQNNFKPIEAVSFPQQSEISIKSRIEVIEGDIVQQQVDAIVNPTDIYFSGGGGVDRAIHCAAGSKLRKACRQLGGCATGEAVITNGYNLSARWIIHTVGPIWEGGSYQEDRNLARCYRNCLVLAEQYHILTIAFPAISTGAFGFPIERASRIAVREVKFFLETSNLIEKVIFVCRGKMAYDCYLNAVEAII